MSELLELTIKIFFLYDSHQKKESHYQWGHNILSI